MKHVKKKLFVSLIINVVLGKGYAKCKSLHQKTDSLIVFYWCQTHLY